MRTYTHSLKKQWRIFDKVRELSANDIESLEKAKQVIGNDLAGRYSIARLATIATMSCTKFKAAFKAYTGYNAFEYAHVQRMKLAHKLVSENYYPIKTIARQCGYKYTTNFNTAFKRSYGISAKKLRSHPAK